MNKYKKRLMELKRSREVYTFEVPAQIGWVGLYLLVGVVAALVFTGGSAAALLLGTLAWPVLVVVWLMGGILKFILAVALVIFALWLVAKIIED